MKQAFNDSLKMALDLFVFRHRLLEYHLKVAVSRNDLYELNVIVVGEGKGENVPSIHVHFLS
jgi:hypothetical protein